MNTTLELMQRFCGDKDNRYTLSRPWRNGDWTYATDGRIIVRTRADLGLPQCEPDKVLPAHGLPYWTAERDHPVTMPPEPPAVKMEECGECDGTGRLPNACRNCDGTGFVECSECGHEDECEECDGEGVRGPRELACMDCNTTGKRAKEYPAVHVVGNNYIRDNYARLLMDVGAQVYRMKQHATAVAFTIGDDIDGALMLANKP